MKSSILHFVSLMRGGGIRVSTSEVLDALLGMAHIDLLDRNQFKALLQATLIKDAKDLAAFEQYFDMAFTALDVPPNTLTAALDQTGLSEPVRDILKQANGLFSPTFRKLLLEGLTGLASAIADMGQKVQLQEMQYPLLQAPRFAARIRKEFGMDQWEEQTAHLLDRLAQQGVSAHQIALLEGQISERAGLLSHMIQEYVNRQARGLPRTSRAKDLSSSLMEKGFTLLNDWEIRAMRQVVRELVKKIRDESALRHRKRRVGRFDLKQTLRRSLRYGGVPMEVAFRTRKRTKARIAALCDVSNSVWNVSRFMLHLIYSLQDQFEKVRSFVFVGQLGEVTAYLENADVNQAMETTLHNANILYNTYTDYGSVFRQFCEEYIDAINRRTTFIVIGDGRNNYFPSGHRFLARIRAKARRVIWLNPEHKGSWVFGDSNMDCYGPLCDEVRECRNMKQLMEFINLLTL